MVFFEYLESEPRAVELPLSLVVERRQRCDAMETKDAGTGMAVAVLLAILGLIIFIGVILLMMWKQPGIEHSPSQEISSYAPSSFSQVSRELQPAGRYVDQYQSLFGSVT